MCRIRCVYWHLAIHELDAIIEWRLENGNNLAFVSVMCLFSTPIRTFCQKKKNKTRIPDSTRTPRKYGVHVSKTDEWVIFCFFVCTPFGQIWIWPFLKTHDLLVTSQITKIFEVKVLRIYLNNKTKNSHITSNTYCRPTNILHSCQRQQNKN